MGKSRASGRVAVAGSLTLWLFAATAFVTPRSGAPNSREASLRGKVGHELEIRAFENAAQFEGAQPSSLNWGSLAAFVAAFGLAVSFATTPALAEEAAAPATEAAAPAEAKKLSRKEEFGIESSKVAAAPSKDDRLKSETGKLASENTAELGTGLSTGGGTYAKSTKNRRKTGIIKDKDTSKPQTVGSSSSSGGQKDSLPAPAVGVRVPGKNKVIISPADLRDEDEMPLTAPNGLVLFLWFFACPLIFIGFWVLGSLNVI